MAERAPVLVLVSEDPRVSHRANEAIRIAVGIVAGEHPVDLVLTGPAVHLLDADTDDLVDGDDIARFRSALARLGVPFHVERAALPDDPDWNPDGHAVVPVGLDELARLVARAARALIF